MRRLLLISLLVLVAPPKLQAQETPLEDYVLVERVVWDSIRARSVQSRAFTRASETVWNDVIGRMDAAEAVSDSLLAALGPSTPPPPEPEPEPDPGAVIDPDPGDVEPLYADDFGRPGTTTRQSPAVNGWEWGGGRAIAPNPMNGGDPAVLFPFGPDAPGEDSWEELPVYRQPGTDEVWFEYTVWIPENYAHRDERPNNNKWWRYADTRGGGGDVIFLLEGRPGNEPGVITETRAYYGSDGWGTGTTIERGAPLVTTEDLGNSMHLRFHLRTGSEEDPYSVWQGWKNGEVLHDIRIEDVPINSRTLGGAYFFGWSNSGFTEQTNIYLDDFRVWFTDPGW